MAIRARRRQLVATVVALAIVVPLVILGVSAVRGSGSGRDPTATPTTGTAPPSAPSGSASPATTAAPTAADIDAARACEAFTVYLQDAQKGSIPAAVGRALVDDAGVLVKGARTASVQPRWAALGSDLLAAADDVVKKDVTALDKDGAAAGGQCRAVPAAAAAAGGFQRSG